MAGRRGCDDFLDLSTVDHPACRLLQQYKHRGVPVVLGDGNWTEVQRQAALRREPLKSTLEYASFL